MRRGALVSTHLSIAGVLRLGAPIGGRVLRKPRHLLLAGLGQRSPRPREVGLQLWLLAQQLRPPPRITNCPRTVEPPSRGPKDPHDGLPSHVAAEEPVEEIMPI